MTVYVDTSEIPWRNRLWCHMAADDLDDLHRFARSLGLKREWFQRYPKASSPHYDIVIEKRPKAIEKGAILVSPPEIVLVGCNLGLLWLETDEGMGLEDEERERLLKSFRFRAEKMEQHVREKIPDSATLSRESGLPAQADLFG